MARAGMRVPARQAVMRKAAMPVSRAEPVSIVIDDKTQVSGLMEAPAGARAGFVFAHGAGAGRFLAYSVMNARIRSLMVRGLFGGDASEGPRARRRR